MPLPGEYWRATEDFERFISDLKAISLLTTSNQCYTMARSVLHVFRSHVSVAEALRFADILPPVLRAIFVEDWQPSAEIPTFPDDEALMAEVKAIRADHNFSTDTAIGEVAEALRKQVPATELERVLKDFPPAARRYWLGS